MYTNCTMLRNLFLSPLCLWLTAGFLNAGPVNIGGNWYEFSFGRAPSQVSACTDCGASSGGNSQYADNPPYTFTAPTGGAIITIEDAFLRGDRFSISIDGGPFLSTSVPLNDGASLCGDGTNPATCKLDSTYSHGVFSVAPGAHSFTIDIIQNASGTLEGAAYFRLDPLVRTWTALLPSGTAPSARQGSSAVFRDIANDMVMFGGNTAGCSSTTPSLNDTWLLSGANGIGAATWTEEAPFGGPPPGRRGHSAVYNSNTDRMIIFGGDAFGCSSSKLNDLWVLRNATGAAQIPTWFLQSPTGPIPPSRSDHVAVYNGNTDQMILFGGTGTSLNSLTDLWVLSNASGCTATPAWTQLSPAGTGPTTTSYMAGTYDPTTDALTLFAGFVCCAGPASNQVWLLSNASGSAGTPTWSNPTPSGMPPSARVGPVGSYSGNFNNDLFFGGSDTNSLWGLSDANGSGAMAWKPFLPTGTPPPARGGIAATPAAFGDGSTARFVIFGGAGSTGTLNDVWVLSE